MARRDDFDDGHKMPHHSRTPDIEICEGCGATTDWSKETNPENPVEGGLCENCFSGMPTGDFVSPIMTDSGKPTWARHGAHTNRPEFIRPEDMN